MKISKTLTPEVVVFFNILFIYTLRIYCPAGKGALEINFTAEQPALMQTTA